MGRRNTEEPKIKKLTWKMQKSLVFVLCVIVFLMTLLIGRLVYLNNENGERYGQRVLSQQSYVTTTIPYKRGNITDRNGIVLAKSEKVYSIILDPKVILTYEKYQKEPTIEALNEVFGFERADIEKYLKENPSSSYIKLRDKEGFDTVSEFRARQAKNKYIKGVWFEQEYLRTYPYDSLASHVIGFSNKENVGSYGLEQYYNSMLNGVNGKDFGYYDSELNLERIEKAAVNGYSIISTIDVNIQSIVERKVNEFRETIGANNIGVLVMNPNNGEILAMASNGEYNLNDPFDMSSSYSEEEIAAMDDEETLNANYTIWKNFCVNDTFEPGSTFKNITVAAALEEAKTYNGQTYYCKGFEEIGGWKISCNSRSGHGNLALADSLMQSCNCALIKIAADLGRDKFLNYQKHFGFDRRTGIDLPGEAYGILIKPENLNATELATSSFGLRFNVTMVQMAAAFSSLINGGDYYQPHVMKEIRTDNGAIVEQMITEPVRKTVSKETSEFFKDAMYRTVTDGTAKSAHVEGYLIGGKTGTGQKLPRDSKKYIVSFISCAPVNDPEVVVYVVIDEVQDEEVNGSSKPATELTAAIYSEILPFLGVYPDGEITYHTNLDLMLSKPNGNTGEVPEPSEENEFTVIYNPAENEKNPDTVPEMGETPPVSESGETDPGDTEPEDTEPEDTEPEDTEPEDIEPEDTEAGDTVSGDTEGT